MLQIIKIKADKETLEKTAIDLEGYIKVVVDIEKEILSAGGTRHIDGQQLLLKEGSLQKNLWGGGLDLDTGGIDFDSMINIRPSQNNTSREVLDSQVRQKIQEIIEKLLK